MSFDEAFKSIGELRRDIATFNARVSKLEKPLQRLVEVESRVVEAGERLASLLEMADDLGALLRRLGVSAESLEVEEPTLVGTGNIGGGGLADAFSELIAPDPAPIAVGPPIATLEAAVGVSSPEGAD